LKIRSKSWKRSSAACKQELDAAEGKVQMLVKQRDGSLKAEPFLEEKSF
jgi:exodeoxyribonuclease VII small subunit